jgi:prepilin-type N-terminal cleavage/methylation domain-containing protein
MNIIKISKRAFTLVELLIVITIIAILSSISLKAISIINQRSAIAKTTRRLMTMSVCLAEYHSEYGQYPATESIVYTNLNPTDDGALQEKLDATDLPEGIDDNLLYFMVRELGQDFWDSHSGEAGIHTDRLVVNMSNPLFGDFSTPLDKPAQITRIRDAWYRDFVYKSKAPYKSYTLYSTGSKTGIADDDIYANETY